MTAGDKSAGGPVASLPMYDLPALRAATDRYWQAIRARLGNGPGALDRDGDLWAQWRHPALVLSQTCGYPYRARLHGAVTLAGTPDYGLDACPPGHYASVFVARQDDRRGDLPDFAGARFAYNEALSQSGWAAPMVHLTARGVAPGPLVQTGGHRASALAVAEGRADFAALDALTWVLLQRHEAFTADLRPLAQTEPTPALPYICASGRDGVALFAAIEGAITDLAPADRAALHLRGIVSIPAAAYLAVPTPPPPSHAPG